MGAAPTVAAGPRAETGRRVAAFEAALGDPADPAGPLARPAVVAADREARLPPGAAELLDAAGLGAELVPVEHGGRFARTDVLARILRSVARRDAALGLGLGIGQFAAAAHIWFAGERRQRDELAALLLRGGRIAMAPPEFAQANGLTQNRIRIRRDPAGGGLAVSGRKAVIPCVALADALVVCADSGEARPDWSAALLDAGTARKRGELLLVGRQPAAGLRALTVDGAVFEGLRAPATALIGAAGSGLTQALSVIPLIHGVRASMALGTADAALRMAVRYAFAEGQVAYSGAGTRRVRGRFADAFADLLLCDCLALAATRAVHLLPEEAALYTAAAATLVPRILGETLNDLSVVFGGRLFERDSGHGLFEKHLRDLPALSGGHAGASVFHSIVVPRLPALAARVWLREDPAPAALFRPDDDLPPLAPLPVTGRAGDRLTAELTAAADDVPDEARPLVGVLAQELRDLRAACLDGRADSADPRAFALADRYMLVLAAGAVVGAWRHGRGDDPFLSGPGWLVVTLARICRRLGIKVPAVGRDHREPVETQALDRGEQARSYDLYGMELAG
ncbi:acyl-CoA dehydrogenase [Streptomyces sp. SID8379]|uniref:acyl-CoA dehydrogenase family protein n=1 Tax=unclassified Streptomyces TaxID=2593676 RepID=UPI00036EC8E0|nr:MULTISPECIES: acyl-CoA dehydrogenase family protein [unclassified Streptomyces]MYW65868.1 acyl-CoA dehydrogenase [Streptomyces sp. SID8379]